MSGQWRTLPSGKPFALDYSALPPVRDAHGVSDADWPEMFAAVRIMAEAAVEEMNKESK